MPSPRRLLPLLAFLAFAARALAGEAKPAAGGTFFGRPPPADKSRHYFIAAEPELWDFAPSGRDEVCGGQLPPQLVQHRRAQKIRYVQYTDASFTVKVLPNRSLGILGPALRGVVGEFLVVTFLNRTTQPLSMHPHGVRYDKDSEGALYHPGPGRGASVEPGTRFTYVWHLDADSGPRADEPSSKAWLYHSHVSGDEETNLGLIGAIIVTDPARARPDGTPRDVDREFATLFMIFDETELSGPIREALEYGLPLTGPDAPPPMSWGEMQQAIEAGARYGINGMVFGNLPGLQANEGERTRWYLFALGSEQDFHTAHWHGLRVVEEGRRRTDVIELLPASMKVADMLADNPGTWLYHCHVAEHMRGGMFAAFTVHARDTVGADRSRAAAFLGYQPAASSLQIRRAAAGPANSLVLEGEVTVFEAFALFNESIRIEAAGRSFTFQPDARGVARQDGATLRVTNANEFGVVAGGVLKFELTLPDAAAAASAAGGDGVTVVAEVARARHVATVRLERSR